MIPNRMYPLLCLLFALLPSAVQAKDGGDSMELTLKAAVEAALTNNLNLKLERENTNIATGAVDIARSRFDRQLTVDTGVDDRNATPIFINGAKNETTGKLDAAVSKTFTTGTEVQLGWLNSRYDTDAPGMVINPSYTTTLELGVTQPLLRGWGRDIQTGQIKAAEIEVAAASYQVNSTAADLAALVKQDYWNLVFAWQDIEVKRLSLTLAKKLLEETVTKIAAGTLAEVEVYQPQSEVARREEDLIASERAIGVADDELKLQLNSKDWMTPFNPVDLPTTEPIELKPKIILANALANRPDLKAAEASENAARIRQTLAEDDLRPSLDLVGKVGYGGIDNRYGGALDASADHPDTDWQLGLNLTVPLDNSAAKGALQQARAVHSQARTNKQLLQLEITKNVRTTVRDVQLAIKAMEATRKTSLATRKRLEAEQAKFAAGRSTTLDVLIAQEAYSQALSQENKTKILYVQTLAELDRIQGLVTLVSSPE